MLISKKSLTDKVVDAELIDRFLKNECSYEEKAYIQDLFRNDKKEKELEKILRKKWYEELQGKDESRKNMDHILFKIHYDINSNTKFTQSFISNLVKWLSRIAAILFVPLAIYSGINGFKHFIESEVSWVQIKAPAWAKVQFSLPDGTVGWLNSGSNLKYNGDFNQKRKVTLSGEGYFDVYKDSTRPFIVKTENVDITVLGTKFNLTSYENENNIEVVLEEGKLIFSNRERDESYTMKPNDLVLYNKSSNQFSIHEVETQNYISWTEGKLVFRNDPLDVIARKLARWYNINVEIEGNTIVGPRLRATFKDENLEEVLFFLKRSMPIDYKVEEGELQSDDTYNKKTIKISLKK